jgi:phosphoserine phosphatase
MKIGLYGVSRAGKNYLIDKVAKRTSGIKYMPGSVTLKELAAKEFHSDFKSLLPEQQNLLRLKFTEEVVKEEKSGRHVIVDGHYSFPKTTGNGYNDVFTEADRNLYDIFIYMNTPSERIAKNAGYGEPGRANTLYDITAIEHWKNYEITALREVCRELNKELVIFDGEIEACCDFLCDLISDFEHLLASDIVKNIIADNYDIINNSNTILLVDCDRTITVNDTTYDFCEAAGIEKSILKAIYSGEYYSVFQFYRANKKYDAVIPDSRFYEACAYAAGKAQINDRLIADIRTQTENVCVIGITSGIANVWSKIKQDIGFPQIIIGKGRGEDYEYFVSVTAKYMLADALKKMGKHVIAIGDSMIDVQMLETADNGFVVAGEKINLGVKTYFETSGKNIKIKQLSYNMFKYGGVKEVASIWE